VEKVFQRNLGELEKVFRFIEQRLAIEKIDGKAAFALKFVVEELFTNMVKYGKGSRGNIILGITRSEGAATVTMVDNDVDEFDITQAQDVDISQSLEERTPGGLGIYLINKIVDSIDYRYANRQSTITFTKRLE
jgi:anti-sigma regulatory factor (Ser/Thr protein kinase)